MLRHDNISNRLARVISIGYEYLDNLKKKFFFRNVTTTRHFRFFKHPSSKRLVMTTFPIAFPGLLA